MLTFRILTTASTILVFTLSSTTLATPHKLAARTAVSNDGSCGGYTGNTCLGSVYGDCCSSYGWCGTGDAYCGIGCQLGFGTCGGQSTTSSAETTTTTTAPYTSSASTTSTTCTTSTTTAAPYTSSASTTSTTATASTTTTKAVPTVSGFVSQGCYTDKSSNRYLPDLRLADNTVTPEVCAAFCKGYNYFSVENSNECYCGMVLNSAATLLPDSNCQMTCAGDRSKICGGFGPMSVYKSSTPSSNAPALPTIPGYTNLGCYTDNSGSRYLPLARLSNQQMTLEVCSKFCQGFNYFSVENANECYCGNVLDSRATALPNTQCGMTCAGNPSQICGGFGPMTVYKSNTPALPTVPGYVQMGCYTDGFPVFYLTSVLTNDAKMTMELCAKTCTGYNYFAVENANACLCGNTLDSKASLLSINQCSSKCTGSSSQVCGGFNKMNLFKSLTPK